MDILCNKMLLLLRTLLLLMIRYVINYVQPPFTEMPLLVSYTDVNTFQSVFRKNFIKNFVCRCGCTCFSSAISILIVWRHCRSSADGFQLQRRKFCSATLKPSISIAAVRIPHRAHVFRANFLTKLHNQSFLDQSRQENCAQLDIFSRMLQFIFYWAALTSVVC